MKLFRGLPVALLVMLAAAPLAAQRLDGIAAVVNDEVVLQSDVEEQLMSFVAQAHIRPDSTLADTLRKQILEQLIDDKLVVAEARHQGITVSDAEVRKQVDLAIEQKKEELGGESAYQDQLEKENLTDAKVREKFRSDLEKQIIGKRLLDKMFPKKPVPQAEAEAFFKAHTDKFPKKSAEMRLAVIQIPPMPDSVAESKGRAAAVAARKRILAGEKFAKVAADVSDDPGSARSGGDLGFFTRGTMEPALENAAFNTKLNTLSDPVRTPYGYHIVEPLERDTLKTMSHRDSIGPDGKALLEAHARHILIRVPLSDDDIQRAKKLADDVHAQAVKGTPFGTLVKKYSKYQGPQTDDGDLGFIVATALQPDIRSGIDSLKAGQISAVLANQLGFNIFKLIDKHPERTYQLDEIRDELPKAVAEIQAREKYEAWVKTLRTKAQIEYR